jgi:hypothetical protein
VSVPLTLAALPLLVATLPVWILTGLVTSLFLPGRWRGLRLLWFGIVWFACEWVALGALGWMWLRSGFGRHLRGPRWQEAHYRLLGWLVDRVYRTARWTFRLRVVGSGDGRPFRRDRPQLVLCRHAGPGDSVLLVRELVMLAQLRPRIVLKDALQLDPDRGRAAQPATEPLHHPAPRRRRRRHGGDRDRWPVGGSRRRGGDLPGGRQLLRAAAGPARSSGCAGSGTPTRRPRPSGCTT